MTGASRNSTAPWGIREATVADIPAINALFADVFGYSRPVAHDTWKYGENPFGPPLVMLAEHGDRVVGQYALWPTPLRCGKNVYLGAQSLDTMTHPDYQGQGMFTRLASACYELAARHDVVAVYGFPNASSYPGFVRRLNFHHAFDVHGWTRLLAPAKHPRVPKAVAPLATLAAKMLPAPADASARVESHWPSPSDVEALLQQWRDQPGQCRVERSLSWWNYRCGHLSDRKYKCIAVWRGDVVVAIAVWGSDPLAAYPRALLAELLFADAPAGRAALCAAIHDARTTGHAVLNTLVRNVELQSVLRSCGFFRLKASPFIVRQLTSRTLDGNVHDPDSWRLMGADADTL